MANYKSLQRCQGEVLASKRVPLLVVVGGIGGVVPFLLSILVSRMCWSDLLEKSAVECLP